MLPTTSQVLLGHGAVQDALTGIRRDMEGLRLDFASHSADYRLFEHRVAGLRQALAALPRLRREVHLVNEQNMATLSSNRRLRWRASALEGRLRNHDELIHQHGNSLNYIAGEAPPSEQPPRELVDALARIDTPPRLLSLPSAARATDFTPSPVRQGRRRSRSRTRSPHTPDPGHHRRRGSGSPTRPSRPEGGPHGSARVTGVPGRGANTPVAAAA